MPRRIQLVQLFFNFVSGGSCKILHRMTESEKQLHNGVMCTKNPRVKECFRISNNGAVCFPCKSECPLTRNQFQNFLCASRITGTSPAKQTSTPSFLKCYRSAISDDLYAFSHYWSLCIIRTTIFLLKSTRAKCMSMTTTFYRGPSRTSGKNGIH